MSGEDRLVPKRRFAEYTNDWEQCKLQTIYNKIRNAFVGTATPYYVDEGNFYLESNNVKDGQINRKTEIFINDEFYLKQKENWLQTGDIAMVQSGHVGHAAVIPEELNNTAAHALIIFSNPKVNVNPYFLNYQYQTISYKKAIDKITTGNTIEHILSSEMKEFTVSWTNIEEQNKIGDFFVELDNLMTLHQSKLEKMQELKKAYLSEIFPADGESVPKRRFRGFTDDWEQFELGEIIDLCSGRNYKHLSKGNIPVYGTGGYMLSVNDALSYDKDAIGIGRKGTIDKPYILKSPFWTVDTLFYAVPRDKFNLDFVYGIFQNIDWKQKDESTGVPSLSKISINSIGIKVPEFSEQKKIGSFLIKLDNLITLHQQKLIKLKATKKAYLNEMFV